MIDREMFPATLLDLSQRVQQFARIGIIARARFRINILQWKDLEGATLSAADDAARFIWRVAARLHDELV